jgi:hypothetical protein
MYLTARAGPSPARTATRPSCCGWRCGWRVGVWWSSGRDARPRCPVRPSPSATRPSTPALTSTCPTLLVPQAPPLLLPFPESPPSQLQSRVQIDLRWPHAQRPHPQSPPGAPCAEQCRSDKYIYHEVIVGALHDKFSERHSAQRPHACHNARLLRHPQQQALPLRSRRPPWHRCRRTARSGGWRRCGDTWDRQDHGAVGGGNGGEDTAAVVVRHGGQPKVHAALAGQPNPQFLLDMCERERERGGRRSSAPLSGAAAAWAGRLSRLRSNARSA